MIFELVRWVARSVCLFGTREANLKDPDRSDKQPGGEGIIRRRPWRGGASGCGGGCIFQSATSQLREASQSKNEIMHMYIR